MERGREFFIVSLCRTVSQIGLFFAPLLNSGLHLKFEGKAEVVQMLLFFSKDSHLYAKRCELLLYPSLHEFWLAINYILALYYISELSYKS